MIYQENVKGTLVYKCPFCSTDAFESDRILRKHLKLKHPQSKAFIKTSVKPDHDDLVNLELLSRSNNKENHVSGLCYSETTDSSGEKILVVAENPLLSSPDQAVVTEKRTRATSLKNLVQDEAEDHLDTRYNNQWCECKIINNFKYFVVLMRLKNFVRFALKTMIVDSRLLTDWKKTICIQ